MSPSRGRASTGKAAEGARTATGRGSAKKKDARPAAAPAAPEPAASLPPVKPGEDPWTVEQLTAIRQALNDDIETLRQEIEFAENEVVVLMRHSGDGAGDDQADAGSKTLEREQELSLANNAREMLTQSRHAIDRLDDGTYGICESCGGPIGKLRLEAAPRATLCLPCKSKEERR